MDELDFIRYITIKKSLAANSVRLCKVRFNIINNWLKENNKELNKDSVEEFFFYLKQKGLNNNTLNTYFFTLRYIQDYIKDRGSDNNFFESFTAFTKVKPTIIILTPDEIESIINQPLTYGRFYAMKAEEVTEKLDFKYRTVCMFLAYTGCRFDEMASLKRKLLDLSAGKATFVETKNKDIRHAHITEPLISRLKVLCEGRGQDDYIFTSLTGKKLHPQDFINDLKKRARTAGVTKRVHPHLFRHSFATQLLLSGVDLTMVASILGHKDIQTTYENYVHLADETLKKATYRHPLVRQHVDPKEIIKMLQDLIDGFKIDTDERFNYKLERGSNSLAFTMFVK
jgi:integrase/recombinase XerD